MADDIDRPSWPQFESVPQQGTEIARLQKTVSYLEDVSERLETLATQRAMTLHAARPAVESLADNLRETLSRLQEAMDDGEYQYAHGFLEASTPGILAGVDRLLEVFQIDPVGGSE